MMPEAETAVSPTRRVTYHKEEREDGALYSVSLKKVRYRSSRVGGLIVNNNVEPVSHLQWETIRVRTIKAGTLEKLVEHLASQEEVEPGYLIAFLSTYRSFAMTAEVLDLLLRRYQVAKESRPECAEQADGVLRGVCQVLVTWLEQFCADFNDAPDFPCLVKLLQFVKSEMNERDRNELAKKVQDKLHRFKEMLHENVGGRNVPTTPPGEALGCCAGDSVDGNLAEDCSGPDFLDISADLLAKQLTLIDADLFKKVTAWHCLGSVWSKNKKDKTSPSVQATVDQFNAVSLRVISSILTCSDHRARGPAVRAKYIAHWIAVAEECRDLKNFSSLKAIVSALQSVSIHRLKRTWNQVPKDSLLLCEELSSIFSDDKNSKYCRELLMREGTAKWADADGFSTKISASFKKRRSRHMDLGVIHGTVPYLGTFLTDLMMLDSAHADFTEDGLINFDKKRKEFEIIAQIKLLQEAAKNYFILPDAKVREWFHNIATFTEADSYQKSRDLEKDDVRKLSKKKNASMKLRRMFSESDLSKLSLSMEFLAPQQPTESKSTENSPVTPRKHNRNNSGSSLSSSSSGVSSSSETSNSNTKTLSTSLPRKLSPAGLQGARREVDYRLSLPLAVARSSGPSSPEGKFQGQGHIVRVTMDVDGSSCVVYKSIWLTDSEKAPSVIQACMEKHGIENEDPHGYELVQVLPGKDELVIPHKANVYYTLNPHAVPLRFKLRKKDKT